VHALQNCAERKRARERGGALQCAKMQRPQDHGAAGCTLAQTRGWSGRAAARQARSPNAGLDTANGHTRLAASGSDRAWPRPGANAARGPAARPRDVVPAGRAAEVAGAVITCRAVNSNNVPACTPFVAISADFARDPQPRRRASQLGLGRILGLCDLRGLTTHSRPVRGQGLVVKRQPRAGGGVRSSMLLFGRGGLARMQVSVRTRAHMHTRARARARERVSACVRACVRARASPAPW
jgi:hypothetical protein